MTNEELKELLKRVDNMSAQLDEIMKGIHKRQDELDDLWAQYWRIFGELTDEITVGDRDELQGVRVPQGEVERNGRKRKAVDIS